MQGRQLRKYSIDRNARATRSPAPLHKAHQAIWLSVLAIALASCLAGTSPTTTGPRTAEGAVQGRSDTIASIDSQFVAIIRGAVESGAITVEQGESETIRTMYEREGLVIDGAIHPPPGEERDDYSTLGCGEAERHGKWLFFHWFAHIWQDQRKDMTNYQLGTAVEEHERFGERVYDYDRPPAQPFLSYRFEQQAAIMADYAVMQSCGDPDGWLPDYEGVMRGVLG